MPNQTIKIEIGERFGRWIVIGHGGQDKYASTMARCRCSCGTVRQVRSSTLIGGLSKGCGHIRVWKDGRVTNHKPRTQTAVMAGHPIHPTWATMMARCYNPKEAGYPRYGGRGISVCRRWHTFENFCEDMGAKPKGLTIERIDNGGNYRPGNCKWATNKEQSNNRRTNRRLTIKGITKNLTQWAEQYGIGPTTIHHRLKTGWPTELAITTPVRRPWRYRATL